MFLNRCIVERKIYNLVQCDTELYQNTYWHCCTVLCYWFGCWTVVYYCLYRIWHRNRAPQLCSVLTVFTGSQYQLQAEQLQNVRKFHLQHIWNESCHRRVTCWDWQQMGSLVSTSHVKYSYVCSCSTLMSNTCLINLHYCRKQNMLALHFIPLDQITACIILFPLCVKVVY